MRRLVRIEVNRHARIAGDRVADITSLSQGGRERDRPGVQCRIEPPAKLGEQRRITQRLDVQPWSGARRWHVR